MKLRPAKTSSVGREDSGYEFWCQGCGTTHYVPTWVSSRSVVKQLYEFNGDVEHPTFRPAVRTMGKQGEWIDDGFDSKLWIPTFRPTPYCIVTVTAGSMRYSRDCGHYLSGAASGMFDVPTTREDRADLISLSRQLNERHMRNAARVLVVVGIGFAIDEDVVATTSAKAA